MATSAHACCSSHSLSRAPTSLARRLQQRGATTPLGLPRGLRSARGLSRSSIRRRAAAASASSSSASPHEPVLSGVEELPDGSLVMHYSEEGAQALEEEKQLVTFLTKPVTGQPRQRHVPEEVLEQLIGAEHYHHTAPLKSFVKGMLSPNGAAAGKAATPLQEAPAPAPSAAAASSKAAPVASTPAVKATSSTPAAPAAAAAPVPAAPQPVAPAAPSPAPVPAAATPMAAPVAAAAATPATGKRTEAPAFDAVRAISVLVAATITTSILRVLAGFFKLAPSVPATSPLGLFLTGTTLLVTMAALWASGFASSPQQATV